MSTAWMSVLAVLAAALAGCVGQAPGPEPTSTTNAPGAGPAFEGARGDGGAAGTVALHLAGDLRLADAVPAQEASVTLPTPLNGPFTAANPAWTGTLPRRVNLTQGVGLVLYLATNTASLEANQLPVFADLPGLFLSVAVGEKQLEGEVDGPPVMHATHVYEVRATLRGASGEVAEGAPVVFRPEVIYSHVQGAAEFRFVMGPEHPARLELRG